MEALIEEMLDGKILLGEAVGEFEKIYIEKALGRNRGHLMKTAKTLGIHRNTLSSRLAGYSGRISKKNVSQKKFHIKKVKARAAGR